MIKTFSILTVLVTGFVMACCTGPERSEREKALEGQYVTYFSKEYADVEECFNCLIRVRSVETLRPENMTTRAQMDMIFKFTGALVFEDVCLTYEVGIDGQWHLEGDTLTITPDTTTYKEAFVSSNSKSIVADAMVRQLRRHVTKDLQPQIRQHLTDANSRSMRVLRVCENTVIGCRNDSLVLFLKSDEQERQHALSAKAN